MTAVTRAKRNYYRRKKKRRRWQRRPRRILGRRRKPYARRRTTTTRKHVMRYARGYYRMRHRPTCRYYRRKNGDSALSRQSHKTRRTVRSARNRVYHRKPSRVGRPRKKKYYPRGQARLLKRKIKAKVGRKRTKRTQKARRKPGCATDEMLLNLGSSSTSEDRQSKKHSGRFSSKDSESHSQEGNVSSDNQQNSQAMVPKKRGRVTNLQNP